jgi:Fe-S cluster assembly scaffold protein SufB
MKEINELINIANIEGVLGDKETASLFIDSNKVLSSNGIEGLVLGLKEQKDGVDISVRVLPGAIIRKPVHFCFGILHKTKVQKINMNIVIGKNASMNVFSHCIFPKNDPSIHLMQGKIKIEEGGTFRYFEKHVHSEKGMSKVYPHASVRIGKGARFVTDFELIEGRVGLIDIDYDLLCEENSSSDFITKISGRENDIINIKERAVLSGENARAVLRSRIAARGETKAEVYNKITAKAAGAFGHVDCTEILQGNGKVRAYPEVEVLHPLARVTHEANLGGVDNRQLETLMARGLSKQEAEDLIIRGILS